MLLGVAGKKVKKGDETMKTERKEEVGRDSEELAQRSENVVSKKEGEEKMSTKKKTEKKATGTREWANFTMSCYRGCDNGCSYCWALADKIKKNQKQNPNKVTVHNRNIPVKRDWKNFVNAFRKGQRDEGKNSTIMFPGTHDLTIETFEYSLEAIRFMLDDEGSNHRLLQSSLNRVKTIAD